MTVVLLSVPPPNLDTFTAAAVEDAEAANPALAHWGWCARVRHLAVAASGDPSSRLFAVIRGEQAAALSVAGIRGNTGEIRHVQVLRAFHGEGLEHALVEAEVRWLREREVAGIHCEPLLCRGLELDTVFERLGFERIPRQLMHAPLHAPQLQPGPERVSRPSVPDDWEALAECIVRAYAGQPERRLHAEVRTPGAALDLIARVAAGAYGPARPEWLRVTRGRCVGGILACEVAAGTGFVLQAVVAPEARGQGVGGAMLRELAAEFRVRGHHALALGVTLENSARRLYERCGFVRMLPVTAYLWRRGGEEEAG